MKLLITNCEDCLFYSDNYCNLSIKLNGEFKTNHQTYVVNEWRQGISPESCPLKTSDVTLSLTLEG